MIARDVNGPMGEPDEAAIRARYAQITAALIENRLTITAMESCTGGQIASLLTDTEGASATLKGAFVTYSNEAKARQGVPEQTLRDFGVYSPQTALAMAKACRKAYGADIGLGVTGSFSNVDPNNADSVPGEVFFAIDREGGAQCFRSQLPPLSARCACKLYVAERVAEALTEVLQAL